MADDSSVSDFSFLFTGFSKTVEERLVGVIFAVES
jgi:hypothetical protein